VARRVPPLVAALVIVGALGGHVAQAAPTPFESALLHAMNDARQAHGLAPLRLDRRLQRVARAHSSKMLRTGSFSHGAFSARIRAAGVSARRVGENLAWAAGALSQARAIVSVWLKSPEHRANLLRPGYRTVGVGAQRGTFAGVAGALVVTTDFAGS
jgi:uncharacterized protein YkwD